MGKGASFNRSRTPFTVWPNGGAKKMPEAYIQVVERTFHGDKHIVNFQAGRKTAVSPKGFRPLLVSLEMSLPGGGGIGVRD